METPGTETVVPSHEALDAEAAWFVEQLQPRAEAATLVTLSGELGAGKTAFVKAVASALGVRETVTSPTFVLEKIYPLENAPHGFMRLVHIDAYRLAQGADLAPLRLDEYLYDARNLIMLEWPENVSSALPAPAVQIAITVEEGGARRFVYTYGS